MKCTKQRRRPGAAPENGYSRRAFLRVAGGALGGGWLTLDLVRVAQAAQDARLGQESPGAPTTSFLSHTELADVDAITSQIIPTDVTPGAREAGVALFIDRALATFFTRLAPSSAVSSQSFASACQARHPTPPRLPRFTPNDQIEFSLRSSARRSSSMRLLTLVGMFAMPAYGGNRDSIGWKLLGFRRPAHVPAAFRLLRPRLCWLSDPMIEAPMTRASS